MSEIQIQNVRGLKAGFHNGVYICVLYAQKIPPHLILCVNGQYFSLEHKGLQMGSTEQLERTISLKKIPTLIVELKHQVSIEEVKEIFNKYALTKGITCLQPIKNLLNQSDAEFIFELIPKLKGKQKVKAFYHLFLTSYLKEGTFTMRRYTKIDILRYIEELKAK